MKFIPYIITPLVVLSLLLSSCKQTVSVPKPAKGGANFSKYVSIGNSLTAGYEDGGLYLDGQQNSYPSMIAQQLKAVGGGAFVQPLFIQGQENGSGYLKLAGFNTDGTPNLENVTTDLAIRGTNPYVPGGYLYTKFTDSINNLGVPGIRISDIQNPLYSFGNPYYERILPDAEVGSKTYEQYVLDSKPTFFTCWLGNNDALLYALAGGADPTNPLTPPATFTSIYTDLINQLTATGAKGVLGTIPDVTLIPYFNTVTVALVSAEAKGAPVYIRTGTGTVRQATGADLIVLTADSIGVPNQYMIPKGFAPQYPLNNEDVLDSAEVAATHAAITAYNSAITALASSKGLGLMDFNALLAQVNSGGFNVAGVTYSSAYITGGVFSLDGVHLVPRGYAIVANAYISVINGTYGATVSTVNISAYRGLKFP